MESKESKTMATVLQELGLSYKETLQVIEGLSKDLRSTKRLWRDGNKSNLVKLGLTLIAFPEPTPISETIGAVVLTLGLVQNRVKQSTLHIEDIYKTFQDVNRNLMKVRQELF